MTVGRRRLLWLGVWAVLMVPASCSSDGAANGSESADPVEVVGGEAVTVEPMGDRASLDSALSTVGLSIERSVDLPGSGAKAHVIVVEGEEALRAWTSARSLLPSTGWYPVIVGGPVDYGGDVSTEFEMTLANGGFLVEDPGATTEGALDEAQAIDIDDWLAARRAYLEVSSDELEASPPLPAYDFPKDQYTTASDVLSGEPLPEVEVALLPTSRSWEVPAYLLWGGWNDVPFPQEIAAMFEHWFDDYGAEVVAMTGAVVEMAVPNPPADEESAIDLAREQFLFAPDNVWQGTGDLDHLASAILEAPVWYFWWD